MSNLLERNSNSNTLIIGSIIQGRYQVLSKLKGGALSRTYLVQDLSQPTEPKCVLKHYPYNKEIPRLYKTNMRLFLKEAKHLQVLSVHPQIPRLIDYFGITDQGWYLVQELIEGKLIHNALPMSEYSDNCWSVYEVARFIHDICETLQFVHSQKIIHCDLKPNNIISREPDGRLVIIDFGSAQYIPGFQTSNDDSSLTSLRTKITVSPSGYLAPEQMNGQPQACSDFYALGVMAIQAWTGLDPARIKKDSHTGEFVWDQYVKIDHPEACRQLVAIISRMVKPDIGDRFERAAELLEELDTFLHTFDDSTPLAIDYGNISFEDDTLFKKPDPADEGLTLPAPEELEPSIADRFGDDVDLPPELSKETYIQLDDEDFYEETYIQDKPEYLEIDDSLISELRDDDDDDDDIVADPDAENTSELSASDLPSKLKRKKSGKKLPVLALVSISVVLINGLLIAFGLQHLIKNMATADSPDNDFQRAQDAYAQGDLPEAIAIAKAIPQQSPAYQQAQENLAQWEGELQQGQGETVQASATTETETIAAAATEVTEPAATEAEATETVETEPTATEAETPSIETEATAAETEATEPAITEATEPAITEATPASTPTETSAPAQNEFQRAQDIYAQGNLPEAINIAKAIPQDAPNYQDVQANLANWEGELQTQTSQVEAIATAHESKNWQEVVAKGKELKDPALQKQVGELVEAAQFEIDVAAYQRVQKAFDLATEYKFNEALVTLAEAPPNSKFANVITDKLAEYKNKKAVRNHFYLQQAVNHAEAREFSEAVAFLKQISDDSKHHELAEVKIVEYSEKQQIKEAYERWAAAQTKQKSDPNANSSVELTKGSPTAMRRQLQTAEMVSQINPGMVLQHIA
ncbi:serine/threonine-protein kinase [[Leptolyngbya] sp. PCC 7376]|uniref:serine/threonine-protein kinase n=1 Tax=[Leptolyngbya] sp. PCC 7376 TaxID=111781 RepID=UPI00135C7CDC|nr:serine/threonine-protein kinase [[Leptolyngbya] sp. PCC 7376]